MYNAHCEALINWELNSPTKQSISLPDMQCTHQSKKPFPRHVVAVVREMSLSINYVHSHNASFVMAKFSRPKRVGNQKRWSPPLMKLVKCSVLFGAAPLLIKGNVSNMQSFPDIYHTNYYCFRFSALKLLKIEALFDSVLKGSSA